MATTIRPGPGPGRLFAFPALARTDLRCNPFPEARLPAATTVEPRRGPGLRRADPGPHATTRRHGSHGLPACLQGLEGAASGRGRGRDPLLFPAILARFKPMENASSKLEAFLRMAAAHTAAELWDVIRDALETFAAKDCANRVTTARYEPD